MSEDELPATWMIEAIGNHRGPKAIASAIASAPEFLELVGRGVDEVNQTGADKAGEAGTGGEQIIARAVLRGMTRPHQPI